LKKIYKLLLILLPVSVAAAFFLVYIIYWPFVPSGEQSADILVRWGANLTTVAQQLEHKGVIRSADQFIFTARWFDQTKKLRVGKFALRQGSSNHAVLQGLIKGPQAFIALTLPDGYDSRRFAQMIESQLEIDSARTMALVHDPHFIAEMGIQASSLEGYLFPETYYMTFGLKAEQVLKLLVAQFKENLPDSVIRLGVSKGMDLNQIVTLASIIEGEAMVEEEKPVISSVYHNRLKMGMKLQADPTIQYILPEGPRRLLRRDLSIESPYNTYLYPGLPPGPINNPGLNAIIAAVAPADTDYLFFVANGDGTHSFSTTYSRHLQAKRRFDQVRRQVEKEEKQSRHE